MKFNETNTIVKDVLDQHELDYIYSHVQDAPDEHTHFMNGYNQDLVNFVLPQETINKLVSICEDLSGIKGLKLEAYQFARYQNKKDPHTGSVTFRPMLSPHFDDTFESPRFTFDLQLGGNTTWAIVVEGKKFELQNNEAVSFSGTHQIHWRDHKLFEEGEYVDMLFMHVELINPVPIPDDVTVSMLEKGIKYTGQWLAEADNNLVEYYKGAPNAEWAHDANRYIEKLEEMTGNGRDS